MTRKIINLSVQVMLDTKSCASSQISVVSELTETDLPRLSEVVSVLSGGLLSKGSTCGVVTSGALSIALIMDNVSSKWSKNQQVLLHDYIRDYIHNFENRYSSTFCRDRTQVNLRSKWGILRYLFTPSKVKKCISHCKGSMEYIVQNRESIESSVPNSGTDNDTPLPHCASEVMRRIREISGVGDETLERLSLAFDGGVGLQGGACGALAGALLSLNMKSTDHLIYTPSIRKQETKELAKELIDKLECTFGSIECADITGTRFDSFDDFCNYRSNSNKCSTIIDMLVQDVVTFHGTTAK